MKFEWDLEKSHTNRLKHKIDFESAKSLWEDPDRIEIRAPHLMENRYILIGKIGKHLWSTVYTLRGEAVRIISVRRSKKQEMKLMNKRKLAKNNEEFDRRFDQGEDIHNLIDVSKAGIMKPGKKVRITLDMSQSLVKEIDEIRQTIGVDRGALIKVWLHERVRQERSKEAV